MLLVSLRTFYLLAGAAVVAATLTPAQSTPLTPAASIALPGVEGRIDHMAIDRARRLLYVAALGNNSVEVVDIAAGRHVRSAKGFHEPQGIAVVPSTHQVVVANGEGGDVQYLEGDDLHAIRTVRLGDDADNVRYDATADRVYVGYGSGAIASLDAAGRRGADVKVPGHPESFQLEATGGRLFVNVPDARQIVAIDRAAAKIVATWRPSDAESNFPMALDEAGHRLFVGCRRPSKALVVDTASGAVVGSMDIVGDTDDLFWDASRKRLYVSGGEGFVDVFQAQTGGFARTARIRTAAGARTSLFDGERLYVAVPHRGAQRAEIRVYEAR